MKTIFEGALRKATALTSRQEVVEATKVIQQALGVSFLQRGKRRNVAADAPVADPRTRFRKAPQSFDAAPVAPRRPAPQKAERPDAQTPVAEPPPMRSPIADMLDVLRGSFAFAPGVETPFAEPAPTPADPPADGARFMSRTFSCAEGSRRYKLFVPSAAATMKNLPVVVMLHGCKQDADDFALGTGMNALAEEQGVIVVYPRQCAVSNQMGCWNWFNVKDQLRESGEPAIIAGMVREVMEQYSVDPERVFVAGLSAGGAMASILGVTYPDLFKAIGIHSGLPCGAANDPASAFAAMHHGATLRGVAPPEVNIRTIVFQGGADHTVHPSNAELIVAFASAGIDHAVETKQSARSEGGEPYERIVIADASGRPQVEYWAVEGLGHAWSGGYPDGSFTDPRGPNASREMLRFFLQS